MPSIFSQVITNVEQDSMCPVSEWSQETTTTMTESPLLPGPQHSIFMSSLAQRNSQETIKRLLKAR